MAKFKSSAKSDAPTATRKRSPAKKTTKSATTTPKKTPESSATLGTGAQTIMDSAQLIWQTGVNALGRAQQESTRLFEALVKEGVSVEQKTRSMATDKVSSVRKSVRGSVENRVDQVKDRASDTWDRLEKLFEERVQRALTRLGVPGREELQGLINRVDELNARLRELSTTPAAEAAPKAKPAAAKKPVTKKAAAKKAPAKKAPVKKAVAKASVVKKPATKTAAAKTSIKKAAKKATPKPAASKPQQPAAAKPKSAPAASTTQTLKAVAPETAKPDNTPAE